MENMSLVSEVNKIKYERVTNSLFNIYLILLFSYFYFESAKHFLCLTHKLLFDFKIEILSCYKSLLNILCINHSETIFSEI